MKTLASILVLATCTLAIGCEGSKTEETPAAKKETTAATATAAPKETATATASATAEASAAPTASATAKAK